MGSCFSHHQNPPAATSPASYAAAVATTALHAVSNYIDPTTTTPTPHTPTSPKVKQIIPHAHITKVPDGDTFTCTYPDPTTHAPETTRVRVMAIDCPETRQNYGPEATALARTLLLNTTVTLHVHTTDRYNRLVADVITPTGQNFAEAMLAAGAAWHYAAYDNRHNLAALHQQARHARRGLWAFPRPQAPWDYRRRLRNPK